MTSAEEVSRALEARGWLGECLLNAVEWLHRGHVVRLSFAYIWREVDGDLRITDDALQDPGEVTVDATMVLALELDNAPTQASVDAEPSALPWGVDEVAAVDAIADSYENRWLGSIRCIRLRVRWEDDRRSELWCREVDVTTTRAPGARESPAGGVSQ
jgi:hypothetical protein